MRREQSRAEQRREESWRGWGRGAGGELEIREEENDSREEMGEKLEGEG